MLQGEEIYLNFYYPINKDSGIVRSLLVLYDPRRRSTWDVYARQLHRKSMKFTYSAKIMTFRFNSANRFSFTRVINFSWFSPSALWIISLRISRNFNSATSNSHNTFVSFSRYTMSREYYSVSYPRYRDVKKPTMPKTNLNVDSEFIETYNGYVIDLSTRSVPHRLQFLINPDFETRLRDSMLVLRLNYLLNIALDSW